MAHFVRVRTAGFWTSNSQLLHTEMETLDSQLSKAINGDEGGTWAPSSAIVVGGAGLQTTTLLNASGGIQCSVFESDGDGAFGGTLEVADGANFSGDVSFQNGLWSTYIKINGTQEASHKLTVRGTSYLDGATTLTNTLTVQGDVTLNNELTVNDATSLNSTLGVTGATQLGSTLNVSGNVTFSAVTNAVGRFRRRILAMPNSNVTVSVNDYDGVFCTNGTLTASRDITLSNTGASAGDTIWIRTEQATHAIDVYDGSGNNIQSLLGSGATWACFVFFSGAWRVFGVKLFDTNFIGF